MNLTLNQIRIRKTIAWPMIVALMFMATSSRQTRFNPG
jgi:hypothetical protein